MKEEGGFPEWRKALTLTERVSGLHAAKQEAASHDAGRAQRLLARWRSQPPFDTSDYFLRRLAMEDVSEDQMLLLLDGANGWPAAAAGWEAELEAAFREQSAGRAFPFSATSGMEKSAGFLYLVQPLIHFAAEQLLSGSEIIAARHDLPPFAPETMPALLYPALERRLLAIMARTMVLELNVARLEGTLEGASAEDRFQDFQKKLADTEFALKILREYPVLARQIMIRIRQWVTFNLEFLQNLSDDWNDIQALFSPGRNAGTLLEAQTGIGDHHCEGRTVVQCSFSSGLRLIYKPRSLSLDRHFQDLLRWINQRGKLPSFRLLNILTRERHGWVEFAEAGECKSPPELVRFYERQGGYLALLYALEAGDFHHENVIAAGEQPVLVDVEALFQARVPESNAPQATEIADNEVGYSVMRVGLLPRRIFGEEEDEGIDLSGLAGAGGQLTPHPVLSLEAEGTDEMRFIRKRVPILDQKNRPSLAGRPPRLQDYTEAIIGGFTAMYEMLRAHRDELMADGGPLSIFSHDQVRVVLRPTEVYGLLLWESFHPDVLRDALDRDRLFDRLWLAVQDSPSLERVIQAEQQDLLRGDVPVFTTPPSSRDLWNSAGRRYVDFFRHSGLAMAHQRLERLTDDDLNRQIWFIRASLTSLTLGENRVKRRPGSSNSRGGAVTAERLIAEALKIGERLKETAALGRHDVSWVGIGLVNEKSWSILPLGPKLYDGLSGIALFLAYLAAVTGEKQYEHLASRAMVTLQQQIDDLSADFPVGAYSGLGGIVYAMTHLAALWRKEELLDQATEITLGLSPKIRQDRHLDMMGGSAGCLAALLSLHQLRKSPQILAAMLECGDRLLQQSQTMPIGIGWLVSAVASQPLTGFSHGAAGISAALLELTALTGEDRFRHAALQGIAYENSLFLEKAGNWIDLRQAEPGESLSAEKHCGSMWCHGAPGIGLSRLKMLRHLDLPGLRHDAEIALQTTLDESFGFGHCLCHGDLGNLEPLLQASLMWKDSKWKQHLNRITGEVLASIHHDGWLCGTPAHVETPGLMTGLAGIGYELLRLAAPDKIPSVLSLEPPVGA